MWEGVERADSLVFSTRTSGSARASFFGLLRARLEHLVRVMSTDPSYLRTAQDGRVRNLRDWGIPLGRRFRALKLGSCSVTAAWRDCRRGSAGTREAAAGRRGGCAPEWERLAPAPLQTVCLRHVPPALAGDEGALAVHNLAIAAAVNNTGRFYLTPSVVKGVQLLRVSVGAEPTEREHVEGAWAALRKAASGV